MTFKRGKGQIGGYEAAAEYMKEQAKKNSIYVRLEDDGDRVVGTFVDDPRIRDVHWTGVEYVDCPGENCKHCEKGARSGTKAMINFYVRDERRMKVIEGGPGWFKDVLKAIRKYGLVTWWFEIERQGARGDTKTKYTIMPELDIGAITDDEVATIAATPIHDLWDMGSEQYPSDAKRGDVEETPQPRRQREAAPRERPTEPRHMPTPPPAEAYDEPPFETAPLSEEGPRRRRGGVDPRAREERPTRQAPAQDDFFG